MKQLFQLLCITIIFSLSSCSGTTEKTKENAKQDNEWWKKNFSISLDRTHLTSKSKITIIRYGDTVKKTEDLNPASLNSLYRVEGDETVGYVIHSDNKATRIVGERTIDQYVEKLLTDLFVIQSYDLREQKEAKKIGEENIAGRKCEKWVNITKHFTNISHDTIAIDKEYGFALYVGTYMNLSGLEVKENSLKVNEFSLNPNPADVHIDFSNYTIQNK